MSCLNVRPVQNLDPAVMHEATDVLANMGLSVSDAFALMMTAIAQHKCLPFDIVDPDATPNARTQEAMRLAESGEGLYSAKEMFSQLGIPMSNQQSQLSQSVWTSQR